MSSLSINDITSCANCGKGAEGNITLKSCTACKLVKYCSRECQIAHRPQHKKECRKRAAELHDEKLFKQPPTLEDCQICFQQLPGYAYVNGRGVEVHEKKGTHYYELAAIGGVNEARSNLGNNEWREGNFDRALKHYMIAVRDGDSESLKGIKLLYSEGYATKDDYTKALQSYQAYLSEIKSAQRDKAAAFSDDYKYY